MRRYIAKRVLVAIFTMLIIVLIMFLMFNLMPGSPFNDQHLKQDQIDALYRKYGLDRPILERYFRYLGNLLKGDFGVSYNIQKNMEITKILALRLPITVRIGVQAMIIGAILGIILGIVSAVNHGRIIDPIVSVFSMLGSSVPSFVFGLGLLYFLAFKLKLFPIIYSMDNPGASTILPSIALSIFPMANISRYARAEVISVLDSGFVDLAKAKGVSKTGILLKHVLRNSLIPILTVMAPMLVELITGSLVVENIFSIPGLGNLFIMAVQSNDFSVSIAIMFIYSTFYITVMLIVDILYGIIDPRIRLSGESM
ncbi:MAG: ABC transporter permease [Lachnospiraceae bacterium]|nr:ABC transporter permease [Lachnospiraceae bacterium]